MNTIGFKIKKLREDKKLSQENLAFSLDISQSSLSRIENGTIGKVDYIFIQKICEYFQVDPSYFLTDPIVQNNHDNKSCSISIFGNSELNNPNSSEILNDLRLQTKILVGLLETQNLLLKTLMNDNSR